MQVISREAARSAGLKRFFTGRACKSGHIAERYTSSNGCVACLADNRKKWGLTNRQWDRDRARAFRTAFPEVQRQRYLNWARANPASDMANRRNYKARRLNAPGKHTSADVQRIFEAQRGRCAMPHCRKKLRKPYHVDHIVPFSKGGTNWPQNLQILCPDCNVRKGAKHPIEHARENGLLL